MRALLLHHTYLAMMLVLFCEDAGIPMPIPADMVILFVGYRVREHALHPVLAPLLLLLSVNCGATLLFSVVRWGGRPLVQRFGRFLGLDPARLQRAEEWIKHRGFWGIVASRSLPGIRLATIITCALLRVPPQRFLPAQVLGTALYISFFYVLGYFAGPQVAARIHLPALSARLVLAAIVAVGMPLLLHRMRKSHPPKPETSLFKLRVALLLGLFAGLVELGLAWSVLVGVARLVYHVQGHPMGHGFRMHELSGVVPDPLVLLGMLLGALPAIYVGVTTERLVAALPAPALRPPAATTSA